MKRKPKGWSERFDDSLHRHPSPALEDWRWSREREGPVDARAVSAAWDLVTLQASAEAAKLNHIIRQFDGPLARTMLPALIVAGARWTEVGTLRVVDPAGKEYWPRDLAFIPGREHLPPELTISCSVESGRNLIDFMVAYEHTAHLPLVGEEPLQSVSRKRTMALLLGDQVSGRKDAADRRTRDIELQAEDYLVVRYERSELWGDPIGAANEALRTLVQSTRFDVEQDFVAELQRRS